MVPSPPPMPDQFPCWCRAVYSWGGESKRDLGFIEGDLIECLNAGDGSWWVGRLYRDRRTVGSFPSNFVALLPREFRPTTRSVSPLPDKDTPSPKNTPAKSKTFRKPFEAYAKAPHYTSAKQPEVFREVVKPTTKPTEKGKEREKERPYHSPSLLRRSRDEVSERALSAPRRQRFNSIAEEGRERVVESPIRGHRYTPSAPSPAPSFRQSVNGPSPLPVSRQIEAAPIPSPVPSFRQRPRGHSPIPVSHQIGAPSPVPDYHQGFGGSSPVPTSRQIEAPSPGPTYYHSDRGPSPMSVSRQIEAPSPAPSFYQPGRSPSPAPTFRNPSYTSGDDGQREDSPPPPPPPPHRHVARAESIEFQGTAYDLSRHPSNASYRPYNPYEGSRNNSTSSFQPPPLSRHGSQVSTSDQQYALARTGNHTPRPPTPENASPNPNHMTPSPLREAMDGVMEQLDEMENYTDQDGRESPEEPLDPWSPESFDMVSDRSRRKVPERVRPLTSMGIATPDEGYETRSGDSSQGAGLQRTRSRTNAQELPHLGSYVQRMEKQFQTLHRNDSQKAPSEVDDVPPPPPPKGQSYDRPKSSIGDRGSLFGSQKKLRTRKSAYDVGGVSRTYTTKTNATNESSGNQSHTSSSTQSSSRTLWSGASASGFSSTSAGSLSRNHHRAQSAFGHRETEIDRPETPFTGVTYHSSHATEYNTENHTRSQPNLHQEDSSGLGGLVQPKAPKRSIFKKIFDSAKTGVASSRGHMAAASFGGTSSPKSSPFSRSTPQSPYMPGIGNAFMGKDPSRETASNGGTDWVQVRRDVNRSNSLSRVEKTERKERCQMLDHPTLNPVDELYESVEGDEGADGMPVDRPIDYESINLAQVDKNSRFISGLPPVTTAITLATTYVCRPYRSDVQRLRAIFTWVSEKICWEEDFEGDINTQRVIQSKRACAEEYAVLVMEMCLAIGIHCEVVRGYLKEPGEVPELNMMPRSNHWWNAVVIDNEWRFIDCCLASPSYPRRGLYSGTTGTTADFWWFLPRPLEFCWTHVPEHHDQQHIVPPVAHEALLNLPCTCPSFFRNSIQMVDYNTCLTRIEDLEMVHIKFNVPADVEVAAEVEARAYSRDSDGDVYESGDVVKKRALAQAEWFGGIKRYTIKALLPGDEGQGVLKVYAGKRGLMHSIKDIPHPLNFSLPVIHTGENPPYDFVTRHPTPHAQRHDIYVVQPQCRRLALNNTFVFAIRQHPSSLGNGQHSNLTPSSNPGAVSPVPFMRPSSAMSVNASASGSGSNPSSASGTVAGKKPAKLAIQTPGGKILRLMRKEDKKGISGSSRGVNGDENMSDGGTWETIIKCSEKGTWRGLVLADRTARWCVFAEWSCVG